MFFEPDDDPVSRSSESYSIVAAPLDWAIVLGAASSIFFGFLLDIAVDPPPYFHLLDDIVLLTALYAVAAATVMFIMPVVHHLRHYRKFDVERYLLTTKKYILIGVICIMLAMCLGLGLSLNSKLPTGIAYGLASLPFIVIFLWFIKANALEEISRS